MNRFPRRVTVRFRNEEYEKIVAAARHRFRFRAATVTALIRAVVLDELKRIDAQQEQDAALYVGKKPKTKR